MDSEDSDQTGWMPMLILGFTGRTCHFVGFDMRRLISNLKPDLPIEPGAVARSDARTPGMRTVADSILTSVWFRQIQQPKLEAVKQARI